MSWRLRFTIAGGCMVAALVLGAFARLRFTHALAYAVVCGIVALWISEPPAREL